jgi:hypothetical protein
MVHHILQYSSPGDDVLVCNIDSDVLFILLLNMRLLRTRRVFLDIGLPRLSKARLYRRFVCLNVLEEGLRAHATHYWSVPSDDTEDTAVAIFSASALLTGSDYTHNIPGIGPQKIVSVLSNVSMMRTLLAEHPPFLVVTEGRARFIVAQQEFVQRFTLAIIVHSFPVVIRSHLAAQSSAMRHSWTGVAKILSDHGTTKTLPPLADILAKWRRISWTLTYMASAAGSRGVFPSPLAHDGTTSVWGWTRNAAKAEVPVHHRPTDAMTAAAFAAEEWGVRGTLGWRAFGREAHPPPPLDT